MKRIILIGLSFILISLSMSGNAQSQCQGIYQQKLTTLHGQSFDLCAYQDKPILFVNTASKCGFTPQFESLEKLYETYKDQGLLIVGFPSNDFKQEYKSNKQIGDFCKLTYSVKFPMMEKSSVVGPQANPIYQRLNARTGQSPKWNFYKYLVLPNEQDVFLFESVVQPDSSQIMDKIRPFLKP